MSEQLKRAELAQMSAQEIVQAKAEGRLNEALGLPVRDIPAEGQLSRQHLADMSPAEIVAAKSAGRLRDIFGA